MLFLKQRTGRFTVSELLPIALQIARRKGVAVDRAARRHKEGLICWFCKYCSELVCGQPQFLVRLTGPPPPFFSLEAQNEPATAFTSADDDDCSLIQDGDTEF
jgi:hypothetical protein